MPTIKQVLLAEKQKGVRTIVRTPFHTPCPARYSVLHLFGVLSGTKIAFLWEEGGTRQGFPEANEMSFGGSLRSVTEGARATLDLY